MRTHLPLSLLLVLAACEPVTPKVEGGISAADGGIDIGADDDTGGATDGSDGVDGTTDGGADGTTDGGA